jgi:hypothetical protein
MTPEIVEVEKVPEGVLITFEDGRSAIYSRALLYELLPTERSVMVEGEPESLALSSSKRTEFSVTRKIH